MADTINKIVGQKAFDEIDKLEEGLEGLYKSFERISTSTKALELGLSSAKGLKEITDSYVKISRETQKLEKLQSDLVLAEQKLRTEREKTAKVAQTTAIQQARETDRQIDRAERLAKAEERKAKAEEKSMSGSTNVYDYYSKKQRELTAQLRALEIQYQLTARSGKVNADELKRQRDNIAPLEKEYKELTAVLNEVEGRTGGSTRSRNQMLVETNQLLREMPNFAISAQTGILSLSNNLPMFFEAWEKTSKEIDTATNKAKGFKGAMNAFVGSLLSWQTVLVVLVTLLVQYGDEVGAIIKNMNDFEKAQNSINKAIKESYANYSKQISQLDQLASILSDTSSSLESQNEAIRIAKTSFEGYFDSIQEGGKITEQQNIAIRQQIELLKEKARQEAISAVLAESNKKLLEEEIRLAGKLNENYSGLEEVLWDIAEGTFQLLPGFKSTSQEINGIDKGTIKLSESSRKLYNEQKALYEQGNITKTQFYQIVDALVDLDKEQGKYNQTLKATNSLLGTNANLMASSKRTMSDLEIELLNAQTSQKSFFRDSSEWNKQGKVIEDARRKLELYNLDLEYGGDAMSRFLNPEYIARRKAILAEDVNEFKKSSTAKKESVWDINKAILEVRKKLADLNNDIKSAQLDEASVNYRDIVDNESKALDERLANLELYYKNEKAKIEFEKDKELEIIKEGEIRKKELEKRLNASINTEQDLQRLVREKKLNDEQKNFLAMTLTYNKQREKIGNEANAKLAELEKGRADDATGVIKSDYDKRVAEYQNGIQQVTDAIRNGTNAQILELNKKRKEVGMTETQYYRELESIIKGEGTKVISSQLEFIEEYKSSLESLASSEEYQNMSVQSKNTINLMLDYLTNAYADATRRIQKDTSKYKGLGEMIRGWFGKGEDGEFNTTQSEIDDMIGGVLNSFQSMFASLNQMWDNYYAQRQQDVDEEQSRFDTYYKNEQYRIESSLESQEEKERLQKELDGQRLASEQELDRKRKEIARQQALRDKQQALFNATIQTATGVMNIWSKGYNPIISAVMTAALLATMAAQVAAIQSAPIPAYEKGTPKDGHKGGLALVGEKRRELVITPDGQMFYTPNNPTLMNLPSGTHVLPNPDAMSKQAKMEAVSRLNRTRRNSGGFDVSLLSHDIKTLTSVVKNKQENYFDFSKGDMRKMVKKNNARINYIGRC